MTVAPPNVLRAADVGVVAQLACLLEASAPKPGNVSPGRHFADIRYEDFLASALAIGRSFAGAGTQSVGRTVRLAIEETTRWASSNTNLGMVLLLAPLARAAHHEKGVGSDFFQDLRDALRRVLEATTVEDARDVYAAIRQMRPGGLGRAVEQDVADEPTLPLLEVMRLAAERDGVAREYATGFETTFGTGVPALDRARRDGLPWDDAVVETFLKILAAEPDTHVVRRSGTALADDVSRRARNALTAGGVRSEGGRRAIDEMDAALRDPQNSGNPGTTADLTTAAVFVVLLQGGWQNRQQA
jgi:triphosphoribosyl-dephospho-CoA synthase